ncbi:MAG: response regulator [bacterium]
MNKILIIEDDLVLLESISEFLAEENFGVSKARNGEEGVKVALESPPDLILCDIYMPKMNGYEVFEKLRSQPSISLVPFIFITAKADKEDILYGMQLGADDYIIKPIDLSDLLSRINKRLEKTMKTVRRGEMKFLAVFGTVYEAILLVRVSDQSIVDVNQAACQMLGYTREELMKIPWKKLINGVDLQLEEANRDLPERNGVEFQNLETTWDTRDGKQIQVQVSGKGIEIMEEDYLFIMARDITELKAKEKALYESEEQNRDLVENIGEGVGILDLDERFSFVNPAACSILGGPSEELIGKRLDDFLSKGGLKIAHVQSDLRKQGEKSIYELEIKRPDNSFRWLIVTVTPQFDINGNFRGTFVIFRDMTDRKLFEQQLILAKEKAEESDKLKSSILSNISHELRTPLNVILGFSEILQDELQETKYQSMAENIHVSGRRLMTTLNSILTLSQLEAGKITLVFKTSNLVPAMESVALSFQSQVEEKKISLSLNLPEPVLLHTDQLLFKQFFRQILDNAVKFTQHGEITVDSQRVKADDTEWQTIRIKDTGIGIDPKSFEMIFHEFRQVSEGYDRKYQGSGLGLTISRKICDLLKGKITVESRPGEGSTFTIWLPVVQEELPAKPEKPSEEPRVQSRKSGQKAGPPRVLLVEDNLINKNLIELFLGSSYKMDHAFDGKSAIELAEKTNYDIILMDINLGARMDGVEATKRIRRIAGYEHTPVVAVTGYTMIGDKEKLLAGGCTHYIAKPFEKAALLALIREAISVEE